MVSTKKLFLIFSSIVLVGATVFVWIPYGQTAHAAVDAYLYIDSIKGESTVRGHVGSIEISSWSFGVSNPSSIGSQSSGAGAGKVSFNNFTITKSVDKASPLLMKAKTAKTPIKSVKLSVALADGGYLTITLQNVIVSSYSTSSGGDRPQESISFNYTKISVMGGSSNTIPSSSTTNK